MADGSANLRAPADGGMDDEMEVLRRGQEATLTPHQEHQMGNHAAAYISKDLLLCVPKTGTIVRKHVLATRISILRG